MNQQTSDLEKRAEAGDPDALTALGKQLTEQQSFEALRRGVAFLERAATLGSGEAAAQLAAFVATGVMQKPDWDRALDLLQQAATLGWDPALRELRLLARREGPAAELRARVNIMALIAPRPVRVVCEQPRIRVFPSFMSADECAWMIARGRERLKPATVYDNQKGGDLRVEERSNSAAEFHFRDVDVAMVLLHARMAHTIGLPSEGLEPTNVLHYAPGQRFAPHFDFLDANVPGLASDMARRGQRIVTLLVYLNDDYDGGETDFPRLGYRFKGRAGDALMFANVDLAGEPDPRTLHAGLAPTRGEKWLLSQWVRDRPAGG